MQYLTVVFPGFNGEFTYHTNLKSNLLGQIVECSFKKESKIGIVTSVSETKPKFETKELEVIKKLEYLKLSKEKLDLVKWIADYYFSPFHKILNLFYPKQFLKQLAKPKKSELEKPIISNTKFEIRNTNLHTLTPDQSKALKDIQKSKIPVLLWGYTGSGKTEVYRHMALEILKEGKQVLILSPEILLSKQLLPQFTEILPEKTGLWHSELTPAKRRNLYKDIATGNTSIVLGTRSALFCPFKDLGLIVIDEEHNFENYKNDTDPRYQAKRIAFKMHSLYKIPLILGTATPSVESYYLAKQDLVNTVKLDKRIFETKI